MQFRIFFLSFGFLGKLPKAPGTFGSLGGFFLALLILFCFDKTVLASLTFAFMVIAYFEIIAYEALTKTHDDKMIVIDEVIGIFIALLLIHDSSIIAYFSETKFLEDSNKFLLYILTFILFRILDIKKPLFIGYIDRNIKGSVGVLLDDIVAAILAALLSIVLFVLFVQFMNYLD